MKATEFQRVDVDWLKVAYMKQNIIAGLLRLLPGGRGLFTPKSVYTLPASGVAKVFAPGDIPTTEIYLKGRLEKHFRQEVAYIDTLRTQPGDFKLTDGTFVIIVRYVPPRWLREIEQQSSRLSGVTRAERRCASMAPSIC